MKLPDNHLLIVLSGISIPKSHAGPGGKLLGYGQRVTRLTTKYPLRGMANQPSLLHNCMSHSGT